MSAVVPPAPPPPIPRGGRKGRLSRGALLGIVAGGLLVVVAAAAIVVALRKPGKPVGPCEGALCPPQPGAPGLVSLHAWRSSLGFRVEFDDSSWTVEDQDGTNLKLRQAPARGDLAVWVQGFRSSAGSPSNLVRKQLGDLSGSVVSLSTDDDPADRILGPQVGFVEGYGATYRGTTRNGQGPGGPEWVYALASTDGKVTVVVTAASTETDFHKRADALSGADEILDYIRFPEQLG